MKFLHGFLLILFIILSLLIGVLFIILLSQPAEIDPNKFEWLPGNISNRNINMSSAYISDFKYNISDKDFFLYISWKEPLLSPITEDRSNLTSPRYLFYEKPFISWTIIENNTNIDYKGFLLTDRFKYSYFEFINGKNDFSFYPNEQILKKTSPFINETSIAFKLRYLGLNQNLGSIKNVNIVSGVEYIGYNQFIPFFKGLNDINSINNKSITIDGNNEDWNVINSKNTFYPENFNSKGKENDFLFFSNLSIAKTDQNIIGNVNFNKNFKDFLATKGNINVNFDWDIILGIDNGTYYTDFAFRVNGTFNSSEELFTNIKTASIEQEGGIGQKISESNLYNVTSKLGFINNSLEFYLPFEVPFHDNNFFNFNFHFYSNILINFISN